MSLNCIQSLQGRPFPGPDTAVVIGIDVGTTFSGVSFALLRRKVVPRVLPVAKFSDQGVGNTKVPSVIYYDGDGIPKAIGQATTTATVCREAMENGWFKAEHFKMHLRPSAQKLETNGMKLGELPPNKSVEQVMGDFLRYLVQETSKYISNTCDQNTWNTVKDKAVFVLGHPNGWTGKCQQRYRKSAIEGGLVPDTDEGYKRIKFVTEGEASALACLSPRLERNEPEPGFRFMIVDAGGGTLDTTTFEVVGTRPLQLKECTVPDCRFAGGVFVNMRATAFLRRHLANSSYDDEETINDIIGGDFEVGAKSVFTGDKDESLKVGNRRDRDERLGIKAGFLTFQRGDLAACFDFSVSQMVDSIRKQFFTSRSDKAKTPVWLVGGFANSPYLLNQLLKAFEDHGTTIQTPDTNLSKAVADGAVLHYLDAPVVARVCNTTYGTICHTRFDPSRPDHLSRLELVKCDQDGLFIGPIFDPIVERGTSIDAGKLHSCKYLGGGLRAGAAHVGVEILSYDGDLPAPYWYKENKDKFKAVFRPEADLPSMLNRRNSRDSPSLLELFLRLHLAESQVFEIELEFGKTEFTARIKWKENGVTKSGPAKTNPLV